MPQRMEVPRKGGGTFSLPFLDLWFLLEWLANKSKPFETFLVQLHGSDLRLVLYCDEVTPGNVIAVANARKSDVFFSIGLVSNQGLPFFSPSNNGFFTLPFFTTLETFFFNPQDSFFSHPLDLFFHPPKTFYFHPAPCHFHPVACFFHPSPCFFHPSPFLFHPRPFLFNPPPVKQVSHGTCTENDVTSGLFHTAGPCTCQTLCFHPNSFLLLALRNPPETA